MQRWLGFAVLAAVLGLIYLLGPILTPFLLAGLFAYLSDPLVERLQRQRVPRTLAVVMVFMLLTALVILLPLTLIPALENQLNRLITKLPTLIAWLEQEIVPRIRGSAWMLPAEIDFNVLHEAIGQHWQTAGSILNILAKTVSASGKALAIWIGNFLLVPIVTFYLLRDWPKLLTRLHELLPRTLEPKIVFLAKECDEVLGAFFRGQLVVMCALGMIYAAGLAILGLEAALLIGLLAGIASIVPYLGFIMGILTATIAALIQYQSFSPLFGVVAVFFVGQLIEGFVLTPLLLGNRIGLHPVAVIFAVLAGGQLFGFIGILLALPAAAIIRVLLRHAHEQYVHSPWYGRAS